MSRTVTMRHSAKARAEEERLIAEMMAKDAEGEQVTEETIEVFDPNQPNPVESDVPTDAFAVDEAEQVTDPFVEPEPTPEPVLDLEPKQKPTPEPEHDAAYYRDKWLEEKGRTSSQKVKYDANIFKLRQENSSLKQTVFTLKSQIVSLQEAQSTASASSLDNVFTQDVVDVLGTETSDAIQSVVKSLQSQVSDLNKKLSDQTLQTDRDRAASASADTYTSFVAALRHFVPDCDALNKDPGFIAWLGQPEPETGMQRMKLMHAAQHSGDVVRVSAFFNEYKNSRKPADNAKPVNDSVEKRIAPVSKGSGEQTVTTQKKAPIITASFIDKFWQDVARGKYKGRESEKAAIEKSIDAAYLAGTLQMR